MTKVGFVALMSGLVCVAGCSPRTGTGHPGGGPHVQQERPVEAFTSLTLSGAFEADISVGTPRRVTLEGAMNDIDEIETVVEDGQLHIRYPKGFKGMLDGVHVTIVAPTIEAVVSNGTTQLDVAGLHGDSFALAVNGSTQAHLDGEVLALKAALNGTGEIDSTDLMAQSVDIRVNGAGQADVTALAELDAQINGAGRVRYRGEPRVAKAVHGVGRVRPF